MTKELWRSLRVFNSHNLVSRYVDETGLKGVYLRQTASDGSRMNMSMLTGYTVIRPGFYTDHEKKYGRGNKEFGTFSFGGDWVQTLEAAATWTTEKYGVGEFVAIPGFGRDRFPIEIAQWARDTIKKAKKEHI